jgi:chemotaxis protein CheX
MDVRLINPFLAAAINVLKTMASIEPTPGRPFLNKDEHASGDVSAIISVSGAAHGTMSLTFTESCIKVIVHNLIGIEVTELNGEVMDAVGELTNMICGDARRRLAEEGIPLQGGIPTMVRGKGHIISHINKGPRLAIPFETPHGGFIVEVCLVSDNNKAK